MESLNTLTERLPNMFLDAFDGGIRQATHILWSFLLSSLKEHWLILMFVLFILILMATIKAMMGRWGSLGSVVYNLLYFGALLIVGLVRGPEVFISDFFTIFTAIILYPICYMITGAILDKLGVMR